MTETARAGAESAPAPESGLAIVELPVVEATPETLKGYGLLVDDPEACEIEIVTWPAQGWRPVEAGTGNEGGTTEGTFSFWWRGDRLYGRNEAVGGEYLLGASCDPALASDEASSGPRDRVLLHHANYHPDGGQMFFPLDGGAFLSPLALPGDDVKPEDFVAFFCDGTFGINIHPGIWHEAVFPIAERATFDGKQGRVHARVSCDIASEFGVYLKVPLAAP
jgi:hypothetical protein